MFPLSSSQQKIGIQNSDSCSGTTTAAFQILWWRTRQMSASSWFLKSFKTKTKTAIPITPDENPCINIPNTVLISNKLSNTPNIKYDTSPIKIEAENIGKSVL